MSEQDQSRGFLLSSQRTTRPKRGRERDWRFVICEGVAMAGFFRFYSLSSPTINSFPPAPLLSFLSLHSSSSLFLPSYPLLPLSIKTHFSGRFLHLLISSFFSFLLASLSLGLSVDTSLFFLHVLASTLHCHLNNSHANQAR